MKVAKTKVSVPCFLLQAAMRSVRLVSPSMTHIAEVLLLSHGFSDSHTLGRKIVSLMEHLNSQVSLVSTKVCMVYHCHTDI